MRILGLVAFPIIFSVLAIFVPQKGDAAVRAQGMGINREQALNSAIQNAVEQGYGVTVSSSTVVENSQLISDEVITHAQGYVTSYDVVKEEKTPDGGVKMMIEAQVDEELILDHAQTTEILMRMLGRPSVLVVGKEAGFDAVSTATERFNGLLGKVKKTLAKTFNFRIVDIKTLRENNSELSGVITPKKILKHRKALEADYLVTVALNLAQGTPPTLHLRAIRMSDDSLLASVNRSVEKRISRKGQLPEIEDRAVDAVKEDVHFAAMDLAKEMVKTLRKETDRGHGMRYKITFKDFPAPEDLGQAMKQLKGYVRHKVDRLGKRNVRLIYWSNLKSHNLLSQVKAMLEEKGYEYAQRMNGRELVFIRENAAGF